MPKTILTTSSAKHFGLKTGNVNIGRFPGGEVSLSIKEDLKGIDTYIVGSTNAPAENLLELLFAIDTANRLGSKTITAIIPYFAYSRADKEKFPGESVSAEAIAKMINALGKGKLKIISLDIHSAKVKDFFGKPFENIEVADIFADKLEDPSTLTVIAPDAGAKERAEAFVKKVGAKNTAVLVKERSEAGDVVIKGIEGRTEKRVVMVDDIIDSGGTILKGAEFLFDHGVKEIRVLATHMVWYGGGFRKLVDSDLIKKIYTTDTITPPSEIPDKIEIISVVPTLEKIIYG